MWPTAMWPVAQWAGVMWPPGSAAVTHTWPTLIGVTLGTGDGGGVVAAPDPNRTTLKSEAY